MKSLKHIVTTKKWLNRKPKYKRQSLLCLKTNSIVITYRYTSMFHESSYITVSKGEESDEEIKGGN